MNALLAAVVAAILSLSPTVGTARATSIAKTTIYAVQRTPELPFEGDDAQLKSALLLVDVNFHESSFLESVERCEKLGDGGRAISAYQLHPQHLGRYSSYQVCHAPALASHLALGALKMMIRRKGSVRGALAAYVGALPTDRRIVARQQTFDALLAQVQLTE